ncbi:MAG: FAD-dependent oxidoreductase, partial [Clostridia bacterium]|nr:FAD-dependent oxidoreductase [Clostridia bacterium]
NDFDHGVSPNVNHKVKEPYAIPYRCLYTEELANLAFAGRNISATHMAMSSTRVMATCGLMGHAVGTAASLAKKYGVGFGGVLAHMDELKQALRDDDCYLLYTPRQSSALIREAECNLTEEKRGRLLFGIGRSFKEDNALSLAKGEPLTFTFTPTHVGRIRLLFDSDIARVCQPIRDLRMYPQRYALAKDEPKTFVPPALVRAYTVTVVTEDGETLTFKDRENISRLVFLPVDRRLTSITFVGEETYGAEDIRLFSLDVTE